MKTRSTVFSLTVILVMLASLVFQLTPAYATNPSIVVNGSFEAGNSGFTSGYGYVAPAHNVLYPEGLYTITTDPLIVHDGFGPSRGDHTSGSGLMFIGNGDSNTSAIVWQGTLSQDLVVGETYDFSAWAMNADGGANALLTFKAGGVTIGNIEVTSKSWQRIYGSFVADAVRPALYLTNAQPAAGGNDFAIDDISIYAHGTHTPPSTGTTASTTVVTTSGSPSAVGNSVTFTATVTPAGATGSVDFYEGDTYLGTGALNGSGIATYATGALALGDHTIQAEYSGDATYKVSYGTVVQSVIPCFTPVVSSVSVIAGPTAGGTSLSITGDHFNDAGCTVTSAAFGGTNGTSFAVVDNTHINVTTPAHALGTVNVTVTGLGGTGTLTGSLAGGFTFVPPPTVEGGVKNTGTYPRLGPWTGGTSVEVTGTYFTGLGTGNATFTFGGVPASCTVNSETSATCTAPAGPAAGGLVHVVATTPYGGTGAVVGDFYYVALSPILGPTAGGQTVTITGVGFTGATVYFNGLYSARAACTATTDFLLTCVTPARPVGPTDVVITTLADGNVFLLDGYTYVPAPSIDCCGSEGCSPNTGYTFGGETVLINGENLTGGTFTFGGLPAVCTVNPAGTQASCITPAHAAGLVDVVVTTIGGTARVGFTYIEPPVFTLAASGAATVRPGDEYVYTFTYTTDSPAVNAQVVFNLPGHTTYVSNSGGYTCATVSGVVTCDLGPIDTDGAFDVTLLVDRLKKVNTPLTLEASTYVMSDNGVGVINGAPTVTANTLTPFADVAFGYWALDYVQSVWAYGITGGCLATDPLTYCPDRNITRAEMAVFIGKGVHGSAFTPPIVGLTFTDTTTNFARYWIESLAADAITGGCGGTNYCPNKEITRAEMSVFLLRGKYGEAFTPDAPTGTYWLDVSATFWAARWAERLGLDGISGGCGGGYFCPNKYVSRSDMAVLVQRTFNLPMPTP